MNLLLHSDFVRTIYHTACDATVFNVYTHLVLSRSAGPYSLYTPIGCVQEYKGRVLLVLIM